MSHELVPLCVVCKHRIETANVAYRKHLEEGKYAEYGVNRTLEKKKVSRSACALLRQTQLPVERREELLQIVGEYFGQKDTERVTHDMLVEASECWDTRPFGELLMLELARKPQDLYDFIVGWKQHFVDTLQPKNLKENWMENTNQSLQDILSL